MLAIVNYGHFWSRELIDWGSTGAGNKGRLRASTKAGSTKWTADFREQIAIYALFNEDREAVYVGQTGSGKQRLFHRLRQHSRGQLRDRWSNFSWFGFLEPSKKGHLAPPKRAAKQSDAINNGDTESRALSADIEGSFREALDEIEAVALQLLEPRLNKQGPKWKGAKEYFQFDPEGPEPSRTELMHKIESLSEQLRQK